MRTQVTVLLALALQACGASAEHDAIAATTAASLTATAACGLAGTQAARNKERFAWSACVVIGGVTSGAGVVLLDAEARKGIDDD